MCLRNVNVNFWLRIYTTEFYQPFHVFADAINDRNPRVIDEARARKLASDLKRCTYFETCATYGLNVETVFQEGKYCCSMIL